MPESGQISGNFDRPVDVIRTDLTARYFMKGKKKLLVRTKWERSGSRPGWVLSWNSLINFCCSTYSRSHHHLCKTGNILLSVSNRFLAFKFSSSCMHSNFALYATREATSIFQTQHYLLAPSTQFNYLLDSRISEQQGQGLSIEFSQQDWARFRDFQRRETQCKAKMMFRQLVFLLS